MGWRRIVISGVLLTGLAAVAGERPPRTVLGPCADTEIRGGAYAARHFGNARELWVQRGNAAEEQRSILLRYDLSTLAQTSTASARIWFKGTAEGTGSNPSFSVYAIDSEWGESSVTFDTEPRKLERVAVTTIRPDTSGPVPFDLTDYVTRHLDRTELSFLIEMRSAPGFSRPVHFGSKEAGGDRAWLAIAEEPRPRYGFAAAMRPLWSNPVIHRETALPLSKEGQAPRARLAFRPERILRVEDYALTRTYEEGKDFRVDGRHLIVRPGSDMPVTLRRELFPDSPDAKPGVMKRRDGGYLAFSESSWFNDRQIRVTYRRGEPWRGPVPEYGGDRLPRTTGRLRAGAPLKIVLFGDSIAVGASASAKAARPPYMPSWGRLLAEQLRRETASSIELINPSLGGMTSAWGAKTVDGLVAHERPDLCILAFGMNDGGHVPVERYIENTKATIRAIRTQNPDAEFILVMSMLPNEQWRALEPMRGYLPALKQLKGDGVAVADLWSLHAYLLRNKIYADMTGNHVNHPNDFLVRLYAQTLATMLIE
ncbi:DUF7594 domain-containing protein [Kiritimatiella glycovorans]|uniref:Uncharacterized protein n=1 Tax=Kiritimatiella glycovorans TaxID=1307763 RepID=A0A0G3EEG1_9BACT|nr:GDSL-type esterase/lipase family protein [Kiritimatiella glycovorans]AKJ64733.1 hypothetical protein L21SP4_01488 [Kiritimatiella glycovorans]